jgi:serine/threonine-protein kinase
MTGAAPEFLSLQRVVAGRYSLDRELGRGGMGVVFLARDVALDRPVAIKVLPPSLAADRATRDRFLREARTAAALSHPNVVPIHAVEEHGEVVFFVMAFVDGETLGSRVRGRGRLPPAEVMRVTQEVAWALAHAHTRGLIHRDVKPDNILLERDGGRALVTDFGIARDLDGTDTPASGAVRGTPQYMSPEQAAGGVLDARSDLYSLGVTVFFAATGKLPFEADTVAGYAAKHAGQQAPSLTQMAPKLPERFATAIDRCLAKDPEQRPVSAEWLAHEISAARGALATVPAPLERFGREAEIIGGDIVTYVGGVLASGLLFETLRAMEGDFFGILFGLEMVFVIVFAALGGARAAQLVGLSRQLLKSGYGHRALHAGLEVQDRRDRDSEPEHEEGSRRRAWATIGTGAAVTALGITAGVVLDNDVGVVLGLAAGIGAPMLTVRRLWSQLGAPRWWRKLLKGRLGRAVFRLGGIGLGRHDDLLPAAGERTEAILSDAAESLYAALPEAQRERLGDVPAVIAKLEADALALRERADDPAAAKRLATAVAALESLRLDLLRLHAGNVTVDELTRDLEAARRVGEDIDAEVAGADAARRLLEPERTG